jgi:hypothetical protein
MLQRSTEPACILLALTLTHIHTHYSTIHTFHTTHSQPLRSAVIRGDITAHDLVNLSAADLASKEQQVASSQRYHIHSKAIDNIKRAHASLHFTRRSA